MKKFLTTVLTSLFTLFLSMLVSCTQQQGGSSTPPAETYVISETQVEMSLYEEYTLKVYTDSTKTCEAEVIWSVEGTAVSVDETGRIKALFVGESTVFASIDETVLECVITVKAPTLVAELKFPNKTLSMKVADEQNVMPIFIYQGTAESLPEDVTYSSSNSTLLAVEKNADGSCNLQAKAEAAKVVVTATCNWNGYPMSCSMDVEIQPNVDIFLNETAISVNTHVLNAVNTQKQITVNGVYEGGILVQNPEIVWGIEDETVATMEGGLITGRKAGNTYAWAAWTDSVGNEHKTYVGVYVQPSVATPQKTFELYLNSNDGENVMSFAKDNIFFETGDVVVAYDITDENNPQKLDVEVYNGGVKFKTIPSFGEKIISVEKQGYYQLHCATNVYSLVIDTAEELLNWQSYTVRGNDIKGDTGTANSQSALSGIVRRNIVWDYDGYVALGANIQLKGNLVSGTTNVIDLDNSDIVATEGFRAGGKTAGFKGIFDGRGYTISGGVYGTSGLFGGIHSKGIVRNLAIVDAKVLVVSSAGLNKGSSQTSDGIGKNGTFNTDATRMWGGSNVVADVISGVMENCLVRATDYYYYKKGTGGRVNSSAVVTNTYHYEVNGVPTTVEATVCNGKSYIASFAMTGEGTIRNCVFDYLGGGRMAYNFSSKCENVFIFASASTQYEYSNSKRADGVGFTQYAKGGTVTAEMISALTADVWDLALGNKAVFKAKI